MVELRKKKPIEYLISFLRDSSLTTSSKQLAINFEWATTVRTPVIFTPRVAVFNQLTTSGALQHFKNPKLQKLIGDLSVSIDYILARQEVEAIVYREYIEPIVVQHMDFQFQEVLFKDGIFDRLAQYENSDEYIPFHLSQIDKIDKQKYIHALEYFRTNNIKSTRLVPFKAYTEVSAELLKELRAEYHIK